MIGRMIILDPIIKHWKFDMGHMSHETCDYVLGVTPMISGYICIKFSFSLSIITAGTALTAAKTAELHCTALVTPAQFFSQIFLLNWFVTMTL